MKRCFALVSALLLATSLTIGCSEKSKTETTHEVSTPEGTTTETTEKTTTQSGENPPPATGEGAPAPTNP